MRKYVYFLALLLPYMSLLADIEGTYSVEGFNPYINRGYIGQAQITKQNGRIYSIVWSFDDGTTEVGTGLIKDDQLSFIFQDSEPNPIDRGVQVYEIEHGRLKGPWTLLGETQADRVGSETLEKEHSHCHH